MADIVDQVTRSRMMAGIKGKDTRPEMLLRRSLHRMGFRFRLHDSRLPGHPDLCLRKHNAVILVHGCYWHRHEDCRFATTPKSREEFWLKKFATNIERDARNQQALRDQGWRVGIVWECALRPKFLASTIRSVGSWLQSSEAAIELGERDAQQ